MEKVVNLFILGVMIGGIYSLIPLGWEISKASYRLHPYDYWQNRIGGNVL